MTKDEMVEIVIQVHATYDRILVPKDLKTTCSAWWDYLGEFEVGVVKKVIPNICMKSEYLPRPMAIRKGVLNYLNKLDPPPIAQEAWAQYMRIMQQVTSGAGGVEYGIHIVLAQTIQALGSGGAQLNGQYDRKQFEAVYDSQLERWEEKAYGIATDRL